MNSEYKCRFNIKAIMYYDMHLKFSKLYHGNFVKESLESSELPTNLPYAFI